jgi:hypothetical protein
MKSTIFWDITFCSSLSINRSFGGTYRLQDRKNKLSKKQRASRCHLAGFFLNVFLRPSRWRWYVPPKGRLTLNELHSVISQKMVLFISTAGFYWQCIVGSFNTICGHNSVSVKVRTKITDTSHDDQKSKWYTWTRLKYYIKRTFPILSFLILSLIWRTWMFACYL